MPYEYHDFPILTLHKDILKPSYPEFKIHWHENPEILLFTKGDATVLSDEAEIEAKAGDIVIIKSSHLHSINPKGELCEYYCMIPDVSFLEDVGDIPEKTEDPDIISIYNKIIENYEERPKYCDQAIKGYLSVLFSLLSRNCSQENNRKPSENPKLSAVKLAIKYINEYFQKDISVDEICLSVGLSKYYLCQIFKEITGQTILRHINYVRCRHAKFLLRSGKYNVAQSALESGFSNMSYFSKVYFSFFGKTPSAQLNLIRNHED